MWTDDGAPVREPSVPRVNETDPSHSVLRKQGDCARVLLLQGWWES